MSILDDAVGLAKLPLQLAETANILLTTDDAVIGSTPKDVVWTHRKSTLHRYRSRGRRHAIPVVLVFALINRPQIFDLRPGNSFVEYLLGEGFDVYLVDWGSPDDEDADMGLEAYVCDELHWALREVRRSSGSEQLSVVGWCIGAALTAMYLTRDAKKEKPWVKNAVLLTMPVDTDGCLYTTWLRRDTFDVNTVADTFPAIPGWMVDVNNKMMKPVANFVVTPRRVLDNVRAGDHRREAYQSMAKWVADNPAFPARAYREWVTWMYKENRFVHGRIELRGERVDLHDIVEPSLLVVTADADHIAPRAATVPFLDLVSSDDVSHYDRRGGHIGLMAGSKAKKEVWPDIGKWLTERSDKDSFRGPMPM